MNSPGAMVMMSVAVALVLVGRGAMSQRMIRARLGSHGSGRSSPLSLLGVRLCRRLDQRLERRRCRHRSRAPLLAALLDDIARRSASGHSLTSALLAATGVVDGGSELDQVVRSMRSGSGLEAALRSISSADADVALALHVLRLCAEQGGDIAESLDRAAATLRERQAIHDERLAQAGQARLSAQVLTVVPIAFASWTIVTTPQVQRFVLSPAGLVCVLLGVGLNVAGWSLMNRAIDGGR